MKKFPCGFLIFFWGALTIARADIFAGVDAAGNPHFTNAPASLNNYRVIIAEPNPTPNQAVLTNRLVFKRGTHNQALQSLIHQSAAKYDFDAALLVAIIEVESGFNPRALSNKGATGLMQVMPNTGVLYGVSNLYNPSENLHAGIAHFKHLLNQYQGNLALALAAYNAGRTSVVKSGQRIPPYPETMLYVARVLARYEQYRTQNLHKF